jgi:AdoMet-dependent rRNA methyltransferase SPB1
MQLQMTTPMDIGMDVQDEALHGSEDFFDLAHGGAHKRIVAGEEAGSDAEDDKVEEDDSDADSEDSADARERRMQDLEGEIDGMYEEYRQKVSERDAKHRAREARKQNEHNDAWYGFTKQAEDAEEEGDSDKEEGGFEVYNRRKTQEETYDTDDEEDDEDERREIEELKAKRQKRKRNAESDDGVAEDDEDIEPLVQSLESRADRKERVSREAAIWFDNPLFKGIDGLDGDDDDEDEEDEEESEEEEEEEEGEQDEDELASAISEDEDEDAASSPPTDMEDEDQWRFEDEDQDEIKQKLIAEKGLTTAEAITLATQLVNREKTKTDLIDDGFKKGNFVDKSDLPQWFLDEESEFYKPNVPITKEAVAALAARRRALDARPIKKVAEAKARKKMRAMQRLETARKKAEGISDNVDISEREKAANIDKVLRKAGTKPQQKQLQVIVARGANKGKGRPSGVKGRYRMVDPRGKKEMRARKRRDKAMGKKSSSAVRGAPRIPNGYGGRV